MYHVSYNNIATIPELTGEAKMYIGVSNAEEDVLIEQMVSTALGKAETICNNLFRAQGVEILTDAQELYLPGKIKDGTLAIVDAKTGLAVTFEQVGNYVKHSYTQVVRINYETLEWLPDEVRMFVLQTVGKMYERGVEK
jgi:hypothetical protein